VTKAHAADRIDRDAYEPLPVDVITIQSQVLYGCVGNSVAVPTLQGMGLTVISVPTVLLSNVPHYDTLHGGPVPTEWFEGFLADLERRNALRHARAILLGYLGPPEQTAVLVAWLERVLEQRPDLSLVVDPVMGDHDAGVYVHPDLPPVLRDRLVPLARGLVPNAFELEQLVGRPLATLDATITAARTLLSGTTEWVVVTSAAPAMTPSGTVTVLVVTRDTVEEVRHELVPTIARGTGDLFTAVLVGGLLQGRTLLDATHAACDHTVAVLKRTAALGCGELVLDVGSVR
jgi:pyridoxine kinase